MTVNTYGIYYFPQKQSNMRFGLILLSAFLVFAFVEATNNFRNGNIRTRRDAISGSDQKDFYGENDPVARPPRDVAETENRFSSQINKLSSNIPDNWEINIFNRSSSGTQRLLSYDGYPPRPHGRSEADNELIVRSRKDVAPTENRSQINKHSLEYPW